MLRIPIPQIQRGNAPSGDARAVQTPFIGSGGVQDVAQGLAQAGQAGMRAAAQADAQIDRFEFEQKKARTVERASAARLQWTQTLQERQSQATGEAAGFTPAVLTDFDGWLEKSKAAIQDPDERRMFEGMAADIRGTVASNALRFETGQRRAYRKQVITGGIDTDAKVAGVDPAQVPQLVASRLAAINAIEGFDPDERSALSMAAKESIGFQAGATLARTDPDGWLKRDPKNDPVASLLDPEKLRQLNNYARSEIEQRRAGAERNADKAMRDATKAVEDLQTFVVDGGNPSPQYEATIMAQVEAVPELKKAAQGLIQTARRGAGFGSMPLQQQARALESVTPGDPDEAKFKAHLERVHSAQKRDYAEDPWAAAAKYGRAPAPKEYTIEAAEQLPMVVSERLAGITNVENLASGAVSPLRPAEVSSAVKALMGVSVDKRAEVLAQVGQQLNIERIAALADQIDKNDKPTALMLKLGATRTNRGRSVAVLVGRGAQALKDRSITTDNAAVTGWRAEIASMVRGAGLEGQAEQDAIDAAFYVRAAMDAPGYEYDVKSNERAVELVVGKPYEKAGLKTLLPRGMDETAFTEAAGTAVVAAGDTFYVRGQVVPKTMILRNLASMGMARDSQRRYTPFYNGAPVTLDPAGAEPLRLTVR